MTLNQTKTNLNSLERYLLAGKQAGCPADQMEHFIKGGYVALPKQLEFHAAARLCDLANGPVEIGFGGSRGPGKSHAALAQAAIDDCQRVPGLKVLFLRKLAKSAQESFEDLIARVLVYLPHKYIPSRNLLEFENGSFIRLGGFNSESEIDGYLGIEYDIIIVEEATLLSERKIQMLRGSLRTSKPTWRPRMYLTTNPGSIGHAWFKRDFVTPYRMGQQLVTRFIPATYKDNPFLNLEYIQYLESLPGALGKAWRDGSWDVFEGMAFPLWQDDVHVVEPFEIPTHWLRGRAVDWGYSNPFCCLWWALDPDTRRIVYYRELYATLLTDRQQARQILDMTPSYEIVNVTYADPSMWSKKTQQVVTSTADEYAAEGLLLTRADNDRLSGKRKVDRMLALMPDGKPGLLVFKNCVNTRRTMPELVFDDVHVEDVDTEGEDHAYDTIRYSLTSVRDKKPEPPKQQHNPYMGMRSI